MDCDFYPTAHLLPYGQVNKLFGNLVMISTTIRTLFMTQERAFLVTGWGLHFVLVTLRSAKVSRLGKCNGQPRYIFFFYLTLLWPFRINLRQCSLLFFICAIVSLHKHWILFLFKICCYSCIFFSLDCNWTLDCLLDMLFFAIWNYIL